MQPSEPATPVHRMFGPLLFSEVSRKFAFDFISDECVPCMLCDTNFTLPRNKNDFLSHLLMEHKLVIADVEHIACLKAYVRFWRLKFASQTLEYYCTSMACKVNGEEGSSDVQFFLLSDILPADKLLRDGLQAKRLDWILLKQKLEKEIPLSLNCFLCNLFFEGPRYKFFAHLYRKHNFHLGSPENLVFTDELLSLIEEKLERLQCIFCDGLFKSRGVLKEHMRKKQHKRINPDHTAFDRFFIVNYLEVGKNWQQIQDEADDSDVVEEPSNWSDWEDDETELLTVCLYCEMKRSKFEDVLSHMESAHGFNFQESCQFNGLNFYQQVKLVNYIRLQMYMLQCTNCEVSFSSRDELLNHMTENQHFKIPNAKLWDQPEYFFPTYENDNILCHLDDSNVNEQDYLSDMVKACNIGEQQERREVVQEHSVK